MVKNWTFWLCIAAVFDVCRGQEQFTQQFQAPAHNFNGQAEQQFNGQPQGAPKNQFQGQSQEQGQPQGQPQQQFQRQPQGQPQQQFQGQPQGQPQQQLQGQPQGMPQQQFQAQPQGMPQQQFQGQPQGMTQQQFQGQPQGMPQQQFQGQPQGMPQQQFQGQPQGKPQFVPGHPQQLQEQPQGVPPPQQFQRQPPGVPPPQHFPSQPNAHPQQFHGQPPPPPPPPGSQPFQGQNQAHPQQLNFQPFHGQPQEYQRDISGQLPQFAVPETTNWLDSAPGVAMEYKVHVDAGKEDCYWQYVHPGATFYVAAQVLKGGDGAIGFGIRRPDGKIVHPYSWKSSTEYEESAVVVGGHYSVCLDNQFSKFAAKLVNLYITTFRYDEWEKFAQELQEMDVTVTNFTSTLSGVDHRIKIIRQFQQLSRGLESRDYNILLSNTNYVKVWSLVQCAVIIVSAITQVYFVKKLFGTDKPRPGRPQVRT